MGFGKYCSSKCYGKFRQGIRYSIKTEFKEGHEGLKGKNHPNWKGGSVGYEALHAWIYRRLGQPQSCSVCKITDKSRKYHWANISGEYKRDLSDWKRLCVPCHKIFDKVFGENVHNAKLTGNNVIKIRKLYSLGLYSMKKLGKIFNISDGCICKIIHRKAWKHIK